MKSAFMGSSRCPRSTRAASCTVRGRPISPKASSAALIVLPENRTSSTRITSLPSIPDVGIFVGMIARGGRILKSSLNKVMSRVPVGTSVSSIEVIIDEIRVAICAPLVGIPRRTMFVEP